MCRTCVGYPEDSILICCSCHQPTLFHHPCHHSLVCHECQSCFLSCATCCCNLNTSSAKSSMVLTGFAPEIPPEAGIQGHIAWRKPTRKVAGSLVPTQQNMHAYKSVHLETYSNTHICAWKKTHVYRHFYSM